MTTTNGTNALMALAGAGEVYVCALVNLGVVAKQLKQCGVDPLIVCSGRGRRVSVEDALCAGLLVEACTKGRKRSGKPELGDGALAAVALAREYAPVTAKFLRLTAAGRALEAIGQDEDVEICAKLDSIPAVPVLHDRQIVKLNPANGPEGGGKKKAR
jgi:2-phosphosulfolactate phosphatase